jgi:hypothetical protein
MHGVVRIVALRGSVVLALGRAGHAADAPDARFTITPLQLAAAGRGAPVRPHPGASTNVAGDVLFVAREERGDVLLLRQPLGIVHRIVAAGDPLGDSVVEHLVSMPNSIDDYRRILFYAELADGRAGLFRADPRPRPFQIVPESAYRDGPISFTLLGSGFTPDVEVRVGESRAGLVTVISTTQLTGVIPHASEMPLGKVDVAVRRDGSEPVVLRSAFEFRQRPPIGCRGFWPDHRPPAVSASSLLWGWLAACGPAGVYVICRRRRDARRARSAGGSSVAGPSRGSV